MPGTTNRAVILLMSLLLLLMLPSKVANAESTSTQGADAVATDGAAVSTAMPPAEGSEAPPRDGDPDDYSDVGWAVVSFLALFFIVGVGVLVYLWIRSRRTRNIIRHDRDGSRP